MPKMKTHSGAKKRFKVTGKGKVKVKQSHSRHMMMNKSKAMKRNARGTTMMNESDAKIVLTSWMPYARGKKKNRKPVAKKTQTSDKKGAA